LDLARTWDAQRARDWWKARETKLRPLHGNESTRVSARTIAVDFAGRLDRLAKYLDENADKLNDAPQSGERTEDAAETR
jgi:hypothetical protein